MSALTDSHDQFWQQPTRYLHCGQSKCIADVESSHALVQAPAVDAIYGDVSFLQDRVLLSLVLLDLLPL